MTYATALFLWNFFDDRSSEQQSNYIDVRSQDTDRSIDCAVRWGVRVKPPEGRTRRPLHCRVTASWAVAGQRYTTVTYLPALRVAYR